MSVSQPDKERRLLPRWQPSQSTIVAGELLPEGASTPVKAAESPLPDEHFERRLEEWRRDRSIDVAAELVGSALVLGRTTEIEAAARLLAEANSDVPSTLREMAQQALEGPVAHDAQRAPTRPGRLQRPTLYLGISQLRHYLHENPRDAYAWIDLARLYTILGQNSKSHRAVQTALAIAPEDRFVLRASARYLVHVDEPEDAQRLLMRARATSSDPWLMAAEISVAQVAERSPRMAAQAQRALKQGTWTARSRSELAGSIGTLLLGEGAVPRARQFFRQSLVDPTENAVAQAQWAAAQSSGLIVPVQLLEAPHSHEARALRDQSLGNWDNVIAQCWEWAEYEPTSSRPMITGSYVAAIGSEDGETILDFTERGLASEPRNSILLNNKAVGLAYLGRLDEAAEVLLNVAIEASPFVSRPALYATTGLILFRSGNLQGGRKFYERAIAHPYAKQDRRVQALAVWHLALEETRSGNAEAAQTIERAERISKGLKLPEIQTLKERVTSLVPSAPRRGSQE